MSQTANNSAPQLIPHHWQPGQSGNPSGRPRTALFRNALKRVFLTQVKFKRGKGGPIEGCRLDMLLLTVYRRALKLGQSATTMQELMAITPFLQLLQQSLDPKELAGAAATATKESKVYLVSGEITKEEEIRSVTQTVELTGGPDGADYRSEPSEG